MPPPVSRGGRIGVAALSGPVDPHRLAAGVAEVRRLGFEPVLAANLERRTGMFAGSDEERLDAFHELAADPRIDAIVFARGGHGVLRLLPAIDWELLARRPRAYIGYSDLTPFLNQVVSRLELVAFHGPMVASDLDTGLSAAEERSWAGALRGAPTSEFEIQGVTGDSFEGPLMGGCLSMMLATLGTPFQVELEDAVLFWEEIAEPLYRLDRMLVQWELSGDLAVLVGMVVGHVTPPNDPAEQLDFEERLHGLLEEHRERLSIPLAEGLAAGHTRPNFTVALGRRHRVDAGAGRLFLLPGE